MPQRVKGTFWSGNAVDNLGELPSLKELARQVEEYVEEHSVDEQWSKD